MTTDVMWGWTWDLASISIQAQDELMLARPLWNTRHADSGIRSITTSHPSATCNSTIIMSIGLAKLVNNLFQSTTRHDGAQF